jgi:hypothetical protein
MPLSDSNGTWLKLETAVCIDLLRWLNIKPRYAFTLPFPHGASGHKNGVRDRVRTYSPEGAVLQTAATHHLRRSHMVTKGRNRTGFPCQRPESTGHQA